MTQPDTTHVDISLRLQVTRGRLYEALDVRVGEGHQSLRQAVLALLRAAETKDVRQCLLQEASPVKIEEDEFEAVKKERGDKEPPF